jgi:Acyl-CoA synthetases (AMP-forming)/AMP-acid ligases II
MLLKDILANQKHNEKIAIKYGSESISYKDLFHASDKLARDLGQIQSHSVKIGLLLPNSISYAVAYFAIANLNRIIVPISPQSKFEEIRRTIEHCDLDILVTNREFQSLLLRHESNMIYKLNIYNIEDGTTVSIGLHHVDELIRIDAEPNEDDVAIMLPTSGSTNFPKRVMLSHKNLISNVKSNIASLQLTEDDVGLISLPMNFGYCNTAQFLTHMYLGATIVIMKHAFIPQMFWKLVEKEKVTNFTGVPTMLLMLLKYPAPADLDVSSLRYVCFGGGVMPTDKLKALMDKYPGTGFVHTYGQTEASPRLTALLPEHSRSKIGSVGLPIPDVKLRIVDESGTDVSGDQFGEIIVSGANVMKGYYKDENETEKVLRNGWLYTGDIGYRDADGFLYLAGRKRNIIISGGVNIYPEEIESTLVSHPEVENAIVTGEDHELLGEVPVAKVVLIPGSTLSESELADYCLGKLPISKVPRKFVFVSELKKTITGKIKRE